MDELEARLNRTRKKCRIALAVVVVLFIPSLIVGIKSERKALAPYNTLRGLESKLFDMMHELDSSQEMYDEYNAVLGPINRELAELDAEYDAIPDGTVLYRRTGSFITKEEYTNEDWARINSRQNALYEQKNRTVIPTLKRKIVAMRAAEFHEAVSEVDLDSLRFQRRLDTARAVTTSAGYLKLRQSLVDDGVKTDADGAIIRPGMPWRTPWLISLTVLFTSGWFFGCFVW